MKKSIQTEEEFDIHSVLKQLKQYKWLYLFCLCLFLAIAFIYNRYTIPIYGVKASILVNEKEDVSETAELIYGASLLNSDKSLYNGIALLKSFPFIYRTVKALNNKISYYQEGILSDKELYPAAPFVVKLDTTYHNLQNESVPFYVQIVDEKHFLLQPMWTDPVKSSLQFEEKFPFGKPFSINGSQISIHLNELPANYQENKYYFIINNLTSLAQSYKNQISVFPLNQEASVIDIGLETAVPQKEIDFLNEFTRQYSIVSLEDKNQATSQSLAFINEQLAKTYDTLQTVELALKNFKSINSFSNANSMIERSFDKVSELESTKASLLVNEKYYQSVQEYIAKNKMFDQLVAPSAIGPQDVLLNNLINQLVALQIEKNTYLASGSAKNPYVREVEIKIENIKKTLTESLKNLQASNRVKLSVVNNRLGLLEKEISALPEAERNYVNIKRLYDLNENVYNLLLQKKVEAGITQASATVKNKIIEPAYLQSKQPVKPRKTRNYIIAFLLGLFVPFAFLSIRNLISTSIKEKNDITKLTDIPILASISRTEKNHPLIVSQEPKSLIAESFRTLRSNLKFIANNTGSKVILITSNVSNEGKTFCSINLAVSLAMSGKSTLYIDADLRKAELIPVFNLPKNTKGLSNYLANDAIINEIIQHSFIQNLDLITAGPMPPNPSEMLMGENMSLMLDVLKSSYEYIVIDTPPIGLVSDAQILMPYATRCLYVIRNNFSAKESIKQLQEMKEQKILKNVNIIYNAVPVNSSYYQYGYPYRSHKKTGRSILSRIKAFL